MSTDTKKTNKKKKHFDTKKLNDVITQSGAYIYFDLNSLKLYSSKVLDEAYKRTGN